MTSSTSTISNLIARYAELVDDGDFAGVGELFADATYAGSSATFAGKDAVEKMLHDTLIIYPDGTPRTHHVTTDLQIDVDEDAGTASSSTYVTVFQAVAGLPLQAIAAGRYEDRFEQGRVVAIRRAPGADNPYRRPEPSPAFGLAESVAGRD